MAEHEWTADVENISDREKVIRETATPRPKTLAELNEIISENIKGVHTYGSVIEAMGIIASAALNYASSELGVTGWQASAADLVSIRRNRLIESPFALINLDKIFYPQYDIVDDLEDFIKSSGDWISSEAKKKFETPDGSVNVRKRWELLSKCNGDGELILQVMSGFDPFYIPEPETTDMEVEIGSEPPARVCCGSCHCEEPPSVEATVEPPSDLNVDGEYPTLKV